MKFRSHYKIGDKIDDLYQVIDIKMGGMGLVFICYDLTSDMPIAIKTLKPQHIEIEKSWGLFRNEALTWIQLGKHPNIVQAHLVKNIDNQPCIIMEYIPANRICSSGLDEWIHCHLLTISHTLEIAIGICDGMIHAQKKLETKDEVFVHRDLKPSNILISPDRVAKVTDFGLGRLFNRYSYEETDGKMRDMFKLIEGTPAYMAPEQWHGKPLDIRTDIYAFGCILYEMITGEWMKSVDKNLQSNLHKLPLPPSQKTSNSSDALDDVVFTCLQKDPNKRFGNFSEIRSALQGVYYQLTGKQTQSSNYSLSNDHDEMFRKGYSLLTLGRFEDALQCFDNLINNDRNYPQAYYYKGFCELNLGGTSLAYESFTKAASLGKGGEIEALANQYLLMLNKNEKFIKLNFEEATKKIHQNIDDFRNLLGD